MLIFIPVKQEVTMPAFLEKLTEQIYSSRADRLGETCIVLPNRRAILYIKNYLSGLLKKTSFLPEFYSIEDFVAKCSELTITDSLRDQFSLYALHKEMEGKDARSIEEFFPYAAWMLSDFNEIDMYLVDRDQLYNYLSDAKAMSVWNLDGEPLSDFEKQYLEFFRSIKKYYDGLNDLLSEKNMAYQGSAFRQLAEDISNKAGQWPWEKVIFAGFNALTPAEEKIITPLLRSGKAEIYWDADEYYVNDPVQEAGFFLRRYFKELDEKEPKWIENNYSEDKNIRIIGVPKNAGQLKYAGEILSKILKKKNSLDNTALVLSDESLLLPMLNSIPEHAGKFNVTMGLALKHTPLYALVDNILSLHRNSARFSHLRDGKQRSYYVKDLLMLVGHPWFGMLLPAGNEGQLYEINDRIRKSNRIFFPAGDMIEIFAESAAENILKIFKADPDPGNILGMLSEMLSSLRKHLIDQRETSGKDHKLELEYIFRFGNLLQRLTDLMHDYQSISTIKTLQMIFRQLAQQERIAFRGEPLEGLQVMGMLETRTLDFDTVIMISTNEGVLPAARMPNSFIPYDMKQEFGLPTYKHNNAVFAYHFYRLLQRARDVYLLYNTESDALGGGEKSRFITQLVHEGQKYNQKLNIKEELLSMPPQPGNRDHAISIEKDENVLKLLKKEAEKGFHPSSLSKYINCPLQFYLSRIARVEEADEQEETIDARTLGIVIHESLKNLLENHLGKLLDETVFAAFKKESKEEISRQFTRHYHEDDISFGKNYLIVNVAEHMLKQLFNKEALWLKDGEPLSVTSLEKGLFYTHDFKTDMLPGNVNFKGTVDRIDRKGGTVRILDYKTGGVQAGKLKPKEWEQVFTDPEYSQSFQLMMYAWLYNKEHPDEENLAAGIISLRTPGDGPAIFKAPVTGRIDAEALESFEQELIGLITQIFNPAIPFVQTNDELRCQYCSFKEICNRSLQKSNY